MIKLRCSKGEKELLLLLTERVSEKLGGERISSSEVMRIALEKMAIEEFGIFKVNHVLNKNDS